MSQRFVRASSEYLSAVLPDNILTVEPITISMWARCYDSTNAQAAVVIGRIGDERIAGLLFRGDVANDPVQAGQLDGGAGGVGPGSANSSTSYRVGKLHHVMGVFRNRSSRTVWLDADGEVTDTTALVTIANIDRIQIGARYNTGAQGAFADVDIEEVVIWDRALVQRDARDILTGGRSAALDKYQDHIQLSYQPGLGGMRLRESKKGRIFTPVGSKAGADLLPSLKHNTKWSIAGQIAAAAGGGGGGGSSPRQFMLMGVGR